MNKRYRWKRVSLALLLFALMGMATACVEEMETGPRAWIDHPRDGYSVSRGTNVSVISHAYARAGVAEILLSVNGQPYQRSAPEEPGAPFTESTLEWLAEEEGTYMLQIVAYDTTGVASSPDTITIRVAGEVAAAPTNTPTPVAEPTDVPAPTPIPAEPPSPTPTGTPPPTNTPTPTSTPPPTPTFTPVPSVEVNFWVEHNEITRGECTTLHWDVEHATAVFLDGIGVGGHETRQICPENTTTYNLHVEAPSGNVDRSVTVTVSVPPDTTPPPVPQPAVPADGLELTCRATQVLAWLPVEDPSGISGYYVKLEQQITADEWQSVRGWGPLADKQVETEVQCGVYYRWAVRAQDGAGNYSDWSEWFHFSVLLD